MKNLIEICIAITAFTMLVLFMVMNSHAMEFHHYQYTPLLELANNPDQFNNKEVQIKGGVHEIAGYTGVYGGEYIGITTDEDITIFLYKSEIPGSLHLGDIIVVDGIYHTYALYGGSGHNYFIATHHIEVLR